MTLHLVELPLSLRALHLWAGERKLGAGFDEGVALHHLIGEVFGPATLQPFRLLVAPRARTGTLYAYAADDANELRKRALPGLTPAHAAVIDLERLRSLPRPSSAWSMGQRLGFDLRIRPVVRIASDLHGANNDGKPVSFRKGAEIDAFLATVLRDRENTREGAYLDWLAARLGPAANLDRTATRLASFQRSWIQRNGRRVEGPDAVVHGTLTITDPAAFAERLARGVGRHRSYGYGMLLLRPPQKGIRC
ncbi:type I-E CRISPR-associated protein Cas6/Cse3/CasE [Ruegeria sp. PrR005]|uniref:Type I-E CRISPR-associated protein Cas6/Cse3/CasE n=1 Tax=Ruegeria sp. PrR005 TaxID=2706882 RepID=A0A6B2NQE2_9RHOB|nr:type I-E CRISPR-associated protein Cas6/Cse3/CasE [Ruegeria sp. PrR005]NDW46342.1 type I-E CRISPR-associated protein Cas6/Cse3/CasE [Ruegeria sp. PrR005]